MEVEAKILVVGNIHQAIFDLPVSHDLIDNPVRVIKTYDRSLDGTVQRLAEVHFESLSEAKKKHIYSFLRAIRQIHE